MPRLVIVRWLALALVASLSARAAETGPPGPEPSPPTRPDVLAPEPLQARLLSLSNSVELSPESRTNALQIYRQAQERLAAAQDLARRTAAFVRDTTNLAGQLQEVRSHVSSVPVPETIATNASNIELERALARLEAQLDTLSQERETLDAEPERRARRALDLAAASTVARSELELADRELHGGPPPGTPELLRQARHDRALATQAWRRAELELYDAELGYYASSADLLLLQLSLAVQQETLLQRQVRQTQETLTRHRQQDSTRAQTQARQEFTAAERTREPLVIAIASTNQDLARRRVALANASALAVAELERARRELTALDDEFRRVRSRVEAAERAGLTHGAALGFVLRQAQNSAPPPRDYARAIASRREEISLTQMTQFDLLESRRTLLNLDPLLVNASENLPGNLSPAQRAASLAQIRALLEKQRPLLDELYQTCEDYGTDLLRLTAVDNELGRKSAEYRRYLQQMVLWVRSNDVLNLESARHELRSLRRLLQSPDLPAAQSALRRDFQANLLLYVGIALLLSLLALQLRRWNQRRAGNRRETERRMGLYFRPTAEALGLALLQAALLPTLMVFVGWRMRQALIGNALGEQAGGALLGTAVLVFVLAFYRSMCCPGGLAEVHFGWLPQDVARTRRTVTWLICFVIPLGFTNSLIDATAAEGLSNRLLFIPTMLLWSGCAHSLFRPHGGFVLRVKQDGQASPPGLWRWITYLLVVGFPVLLALASVAGFNFTARRFWMAFVQSALLVLIYLPLRALLMRWIAVLRRRLALEQARKRREARSEKPEPTDDATVDTVTLISEAEEEDLTRSLGEYDRLVRSVFAVIFALVLWGIWGDARSAVQRVTSIQLWQREAGAGRPPAAAAKPGMMSLASAASAATSSATASVPLDMVDQDSTRQAVTLGNLLYALFATLLTFSAVRNLPGFLQMVILKRMPMPPGTGYALTTVLRYVLVLIGILIVSGKIGISWNKVQWLAAAVTLGIGFGLQEIFANFVSGLILLFERPVRVGDIVTVGEVSGHVMRIHMRATTIKDWDGKELVLPNKDLITGRFVNWTLSDSITRLTLPVGVSYQADVTRARDLLLEIARGHDRVLSDPPPSVVFDGFGASTLNLALRVFVDDVVERTGIMTALNLAINEEFKQAGIEIAFPQQDVHIRSLPAGIAIRPDETTGTSTAS